MNQTNQYVSIQALQDITMTGVLTSGVIPGCVILVGDNGILYDLRDVSPINLPAMGSRVSITGMLRPDLVTTCQQGAPLAVRNITLLTVSPITFPPFAQPFFQPRAPTFFPPFAPPVFFPRRAPRFFPVPEFLIPFVPPEFFPPLVPFRVRVPFPPFLIIIRRTRDGSMEMSDEEM